MKILLIGKNGQLGGEIISEARCFGFEIVGTDRKEVDVTDKFQIRNIINTTKPDILINATAYNLVGIAESRPGEAIAVNSIAVGNIARACKDNNIKFITYSTDYVFDGKMGSPYGESDIPNPLQVYGSSKLAGENAVTSYYPDNSFIIRTCGIFGGLKGSPGKGNFVLSIIKEASQPGVLEVSSEQIVNPTYAVDLSKATFKLLKEKAKPGTYHLASEGYCSWYEFTKEIIKLTGIDKEVRPLDRGGFSGGVYRPKFSALKNTKAKALGVELPSWQEGLRSYFNYLNYTKP